MPYSHFHQQRVLQEWSTGMFSSIIVELNEELDVCALGRTLSGCITVWSIPADLPYSLLLVMLLLLTGPAKTSDRMCEQK